MATIYDVAQLAGVSIGTVSNYMNGKYVGATKSCAIKQAIETLHYVPNRVARALKNNDAFRIMLILPNITEGFYSDLAATILVEMEHNGYNVQIACTNDSKIEETRILNECYSNMYAGVFLCTCCPDETELFTRIQQKKPLIFLVRRPDMDTDFCYVGFDSFNVIYRITKALLDNNVRDLSLWTGLEEYSSERGCIKAYQKAHSDIGMELQKENMFSLPMIREIIFRQATFMFTRQNYPRFIITSSKLCAEAIIEAASYQNIETNHNLSVITLGDGKWSNLDQFYCSLSTLRSIKGMAQDACKYMLECLNSNGIYERRSLQIQDSFSVRRLVNICENANRIQRPAPIQHSQPKEEKLRIVCNGSIPFIEYLIPWISKCIGIEIDYVSLPTGEIVEYIQSQASHKECLFDIIQLDTPWMHQIASEGFILDISDYCDGRADIMNAIVPNLLSTTAMINGRVYGIPSMFCSQKLFYRKDLFEDPILQNRYNEIHGRPLVPPKTWFDYMMIARFFTRAYNPESPCEYGTIMNFANNEMMLTEVFPRIWAYGGSVYDDYGNITIYSDETMQAIRNYANCLQYSDPTYERLLLPQCALHFSEGKAAMMIAYDIHANELLDYTNSKVIDKIGFASVPGGISATGGWNLCINSKTTKISHCYRLLDWILSTEFALPYTLLGGCSPRKDVINNAEIIAMFPWLKETVSCFQCSRIRYVPEQVGFTTPTETEVEQVLANTVKKCIAEPSRISEFLKIAECTLKEMRKPIRK